MALSPTGRSWEGSSGSRLAEGRDSSQPQPGAHQLSREHSYAGEVQVTPTRPSTWIPGQRGQGSAPGAHTHPRRCSPSGCPHLGWESPALF